MNRRDKSEARRAFVCVYVHKLLHDNGRLENYEPYETEYVDPEMEFEACVYGLQYLSEAVWSRYCEDDQVETMYFSHPDMMEYYRLCRVYGKRYGVKLPDNPYMRMAADYVRSCLDQGCPVCEYRLHTNIGHKWASGIVFRMWPEFEWHFALLTQIADIFGFYTKMLTNLKKELACNKTKEVA